MSEGKGRNLAMDSRSMYIIVELPAFDSASVRDGKVSLSILAVSYTVNLRSPGHARKANRIRRTFRDFLFG